VQQFTTTVKTARADLVVLVAQHLVSAASLKHTSLALASQKIPVAFGGRIFNLRPDIARSINGYFLGNDLPAALEEIEIILGGNARSPQPAGVTQAYAAAHQAFLSKQPQIDLTVRQSLEPLAISPEDIQTAIHFLGENILAALQLGDMAHVSAEIDWLQGLLRSHGSSDSQLAHFMQAYSHAIDRSINGQGKPIFEWIEAEVQRLNSA
jgi:hypothetical protein